MILDNNAPILADYCKQNDGSDGATGDMDAYVFNTILEYVYSGCLSFGHDDDVFFTAAKDFIDAANRFELVEFKMAIERVLVRERILDKTNVADYILFADAQSCPLLKEYAISFFALHAKEILNSDCSASLRESRELLSEIIKSMADQDEDDMTVNELRMELYTTDLDVDGSKETLISRLEEANQYNAE